MSGGARAAVLRGHLATLTFAAALAVLGALWLAGQIPRAPVSAALAALVLALVRSAARVVGRIGRRRLWRIRRKLILSYIFIAFVPLLLVTILFTAVTYVALGQVLGYFGWRQVGILKADVDAASEAIAEQLYAMADGASDFAALDRAIRARPIDPEILALRARYPGTRASAVLSGPLESERLVPPGLEWPAGVKAGAPGWFAQQAAGWAPWRFEASFVLDPSGNGQQVELRAADARSAGPYQLYVEVSVPLDQATLEAMQRSIGTDLRVFELIAGNEKKQLRAATDPEASPPGSLVAPPVFGVLYLNPVHWDRGPQRRSDRGDASSGWVLVVQQSLSGIFREFFPGQNLLDRGGPENREDRENRVLVGSILVVLLAAFVLIEGLSLYAGVRLARSITGSIHDISEGASRIERGDFSYRFSILSDDQLGDLGRTFNRMAAAIERQVAESAERERLEEELRIGRRIQQSLLPRGDWHEQHLEIAAVSLPAREVGGDYYDFFDLGPDRLALLVADVSGKGTEAAFYMAEVKGVMLALARPESPPRAVLADANRLLGLSLDRRTFVTMTYAVIDRAASTLAFGRAGHSPLLYLASGGDQVECLRPPGLSLGIDRTGRFDGLLEERTLELGKGDLVLFYTDGVTDTVGPDGELYGDQRLSHALLAVRDRTAEGVRDALVAELRRFAVPGPPHDDLTVIVLKVL